LRLGRRKFGAYELCTISTLFGPKFSGQRLLWLLASSFIKHVKFICCPNHVVSISYTLSLANGEVADFADADQPLVFIHGIGQTLEAFDAQLDGLNVGDGFSFSLTAEEGYGVHDAGWIVELPRSVFGGDDVPADILQLGAMLPMQDQDGNPMDGKVIEIGDETVKMDFNHPLAGEALNFTGSILAVREATADELDHGHVHGEGGHHH